MTTLYWHEQNYIQKLWLKHYNDLWLKFPFCNTSDLLPNYNFIAKYIHHNIISNITSSSVVVSFNTMREKSKPVLSEKIIVGDDESPKSLFVFLPSFSSTYVPSPHSLLNYTSSAEEGNLIKEQMLAWCTIKFSKPKWKVSITVSCKNSNFKLGDHRARLPVQIMYLKIPGSFSDW